MKTMLFIVLFGLVACKNSQEKGTETIRTQSEISSQNQIEAENFNLRQRAGEMEKDLSARHRFFQAVKGRYEGTFLTREGEFKIRITLNPNIAPYDFSTYRQWRRMEEITADLNNLSFNAQVMQWNPKNTLSAVSCRIDTIRPDLRTGEIIISHSSCPNLYQMKIAENENEIFDDLNAGEVLARRLLDGTEDKVNFLVGHIQPSSTADIYKFKATR